jgi:asparagine synthase (glutamine-hydrolysing)
MLLSGGVDSSINLACMNKFSSAPVKTYTVGFENKNAYKNEFAYARRVAHFFKADYNELVVTEKNFFDFLPAMTYLQDEPIADTANIPIHFVSKLAKEEQVKVLLSGEGSDELFIGYQHWRLIYQFEKLLHNKPKLAGLLEFLHKKSGFGNKRPHYHAWANKIKNNWPVFWSGTELRTEDKKRRILSSAFLEQIGDYTSFSPKKELYDSLVSSKGYNTFEWMTINDLQNRVPDQLLARLDRMMMANSIEGRNPFLDHKLVEFVLQIPSQLKVKNKTEKYLLKKAFEGIIPHEILYRPKDSFTVPVNELFKNASRKKYYLGIIQDFNADKNIFTKSYLKQLEEPAHVKEFWNVLNLALWNNTHA